jgi:hypothetical protein
MPKFVVSYDLIAPGRNYDTLWAELRRLQLKRILFSQWAGWIDVGTATDPAGAVRDHLRQFIDSNDRILVQDVNGANWAGWNLMDRLDQI